MSRRFTGSCGSLRLDLQLRVPFSLEQDYVMTTAATIGDLRAAGYQPLPVKEEMRKNLLQSLEDENQIFPEILGYEHTVIPQVENALLSAQDIIFLGERGQAKTRLARSLIN